MHLKSHAPKLYVTSKDHMVALEIYVEHLGRKRVLSLTINKVFIQAPRIIRNLVMPSIWIC